jgi:glycosyltransferase involved in cell wall biosynthesis
MKILLINTNDISGGAAKAANRLHNALRKQGIDSFMLVQKKQTNDSTIIGAKSNLFFKGINFLRGKVDALPKKLYPNRKRVPWSINWLPNPFLIKTIKEINPDIIHLHWINNGFISIKDLKRISKLGKPIVWTLHDSWAFTGGCHIPYDCKRYKRECGSCPLLNSKKENDLSRKVYERKKKVYENIDFNIVTPSTWLADCARQSTLLNNKNITVIPNIVDENEFKPLDRNKVRKELKLSNKKKYILFGAMAATIDKNKGFDLLVESLKHFEEKDNVELLIFGNNEELEIDLNIEYRTFGRINNTEFINKLYSASDVTVVPSRSENLPNIVLESFASGTPVVGFKVGGIPDIIKHKESGYLAKAFDSKDLAEGIKWCIEDTKRNEEISKYAREYALENYSEEVVVKRFKEYYPSLRN